MNSERGTAACIDIVADVGSCIPIEDSRVEIHRRTTLICKNAPEAAWFDDNLQTSKDTRAEE